MKKQKVSIDIGEFKMIINIMEEAKNFLLSYLEGKECEYETTHPWRRDSKFIILHCLRVQACALEITKNQEELVSEEEKKLIELAAILHDIGKADNCEEHAVCSAGIVKAWLSENIHLANEIKDANRLVRIIEDHSNKDGYEKDICSAILKDADLLDEIGALSIFMASSWVDRQSPLFFNNLLERLETFEISYCEKQLKKLNTDYGRKVLKDKMDFIKRFNEQLALEIKGTEEAYDLLRD